MTDQEIIEGLGGHCCKWTRDVVRLHVTYPNHECECGNRLGSHNANPDLSTYPGMGVLMELLKGRVWLKLISCAVGWVWILESWEGSDSVRCTADTPPLALRGAAIKMLEGK